MNSVKNISCVILFALLTFSSCKNDLKLNAPYKEFPSIYAVLNPQDHLQMIRINKVFLGEGDANVMAKVADSVNYQAGDLLVTLERLVNGQPALATPNGNKTTITFHDSIIQTEAGAFSTTQRVYVTGDKLFTSGDYVLKVKNIKTNNVFTATAAALDSVNKNGNIGGLSPYDQNHYYGDPDNLNYLGNSNVYIDYHDPKQTIYLRYTPTDAIIYQSKFRLHYIDSMLSGQAISNYVDFEFTRQNKKDAVLAGTLGPYITNSFKASEIYNTVAASMARSSVPVSQIVGRRMYKIQYFIFTSSQDYLDYLQFAAPSLSIAQEKPMYSNFAGKNALGIFAFRTRYAISREMDVAFISQFAFNTTTCKYKWFQVPQMTIPFCP